MQTEDLIFAAKMLTLVVSVVFCGILYFTVPPRPFECQISKRYFRIVQYREGGMVFHLLLLTGYLCLLNVIFGEGQRWFSGVVFVLSLLLYASRFFSTRVCIDLQQESVQVVFDRLILKTTEDYPLEKMVAVMWSREQRFQTGQYSKMGGLRWVLKLRFDLLDELRDIEIFSRQDDYSAGQTLLALKCYLDHQKTNNVAFIYSQDDFHQVHPFGEIDELEWQHKLLKPYLNELGLVINTCDLDTSLET